MKGVPKMAVRKMSRSVSVIGVGATKFGDPADTPELVDLCFQDLAAWAAFDAMDDAGVNARDIGKLSVAATCGPLYLNETIAANNGLLEMLGMTGKSSSFHSEGCAAGFLAFNECVDAVASGRVDIALALVAEHSRWITAPDMPSCYRWPNTEYKNLYGRDFYAASKAFDCAYSRWNGSWIIGNDSPSRAYIRKTGITNDELEDAMIGQSITAREHSVRHPIAYAQETWEEVAKKRELSSAEEFMRSPYNPKLSEYMRPAYCALQNDGAAAIIVCATEIADQFKQKPVEIVNIVQVDMSSGSSINVKSKMTKLAAKEIYDITGYKPEDIDLLEIGDHGLADELQGAEDVGYLPQGEGWKYFRDRRTRFDKDKPINTCGSSLGVGHAFGAPDLVYIREITLQTRGQAGERQMPIPPKVSLLRGIGANQSCTMAIFKAVE